MRALLLCAIAFAGCGRVGFDALGASDAGSDGEIDANDDLTAGLLLHLPFDDLDQPYADTSPFHRATRCYQGTCPPLFSPSARPTLGTTAIFAATQCIYVDDFTTLHPAAFTVSVWVRGRMAENIWAFPYNGATNTADTLELFWDADDQLRAQGFNFPNNGLLGPVNVDNTWQHIALTYDATTVRLYVNGALVAEQVDELQWASDPFDVGCDTDPAPNDLETPLDGAIDEVRIYDRALDAAAIAALAQ